MFVEASSDAFGARSISVLAVAWVAVPMDADEDDAHVSWSRVAAAAAAAGGPLVVVALAASSLPHSHIGSGTPADGVMNRSTASSPLYPASAILVAESTADMAQRECRTRLIALQPDLPQRPPRQQCASTRDGEETEHAHGGGQESASREIRITRGEQVLLSIFSPLLHLAPFLLSCETLVFRILT